MAISWTYTTLVAALKEWAEDDSTEFNDALDDIVALGETRLLKDLKLSFLDSTEAISFTSGTATVTKPSGWVATQALWYTSSGAYVFVQPRSFEFVKDYTPDSSTTGAPLYYAENSDTTWIFAPTPNFTGSGNARVVKRPSGLSGSVSTTWLGTNAGEALFYSCLIASEQFLKTDMDNPSRIKMWEEAYKAALTNDLIEMVNSSRSDYKALAPSPKV